MNTYALTVGDPLGIGPEITLKVLEGLRVQRHSAFRLLVLGDLEHLAETAKSLGIAWQNLFSYPAFEWVDVRSSLPRGSEGWAGDIAYRSVVQAVQRIEHGQVQGLVTGPLSKERLWKAGHPQTLSGHTELLEQLANTSIRWLKTAEGQPSVTYQSDMLFLYKQFRLLLLTRHIPLASISGSLTQQGLERSLRSLIRFLVGPLGISQPSVGVLGVNPHAGEIGGHEEQDILWPVIQRINGEAMAHISRPLPADAAFRGFQPESPAYDAYLAMYHDQGLIPMKLLGGFEAVNVTIGLPFLRTSVSHGTADDIVGQGIASAASLSSAMNCLHRLITEES